MYSETDQALGLKPGAFKLWVSAGFSLHRPTAPPSSGCSTMVQRYKSHLKANFETGFSVDRLTG
jgi:hypothetical protein